MDRTQTKLGSGFVSEGWWVGSAWLELGIIDRRAGRNIDLRVPLVTEAREPNTVGYSNRDQNRMAEARKEYQEALKIYEAFAKQDPEQFTTDVKRLIFLIAAYLPSPLALILASTVSPRNVA